MEDRGFTATATLTLALCIAANAAIFAVVNSVLLRPLPVPEPERLVLIHNSYVVREGLVLLVAGLVVGLAGAFAIRRTMESQLYGIGGMDPVVVSAVAAVLGIVALTACVIPARRAARTDQTVALSEQ